MSMTTKSISILDLLTLLQSRGISMHITTIPDCVSISLYKEGKTEGFYVSTCFDGWANDAISRIEEICYRLEGEPILYRPKAEPVLCIPKEVLQGLEK